MVLAWLMQFESMIVDGVECGNESWRGLEFSTKRRFRRWRGRMKAWVRAAPNRKIRIGAEYV